MTLLTVLTIAALSAPAVDVPSFDAFFKEFAVKRNAITSLDARFTQITKVPEEELTTDGALAYRQPRRIVFRTEKPDRTTLIEEHRGYEYEPEIKQLVIYDIEDNPRAEVFFLGFDNDTEALRKAYDVSLFVTDDARGSRGILIKPKPVPDEDPLFIEVKLFLRNEDYLPYRIAVQNDKDSQVTIDVKEYKINTALADDRMKIKVASGTKVVENNQVLETVGEGGKTFPDALKANPDAKEAPAESAVKAQELAAPAAESK
jgi:outer membrane lipoprotein-sorting protein